MIHQALAVSILPCSAFKALSPFTCAVHDHDQPVAQLNAQPHHNQTIAHIVRCYPQLLTTYNHATPYMVYIPHCCCCYILCNTVDALTTYMMAHNVQKLLVYIPQLVQQCRRSQA